MDAAAASPTDDGRGGVFPGLARDGKGASDVAPDLDLFERQSKTFSMIPLLPGQKKPATREWEQWCETKRPFRREDFKGRNAGVACGPASGVLVLDVDDEAAFARLAEAHHWEIPSTYTVRTGRGRPHFYLKYPADGQKYGNLSIKHPVWKKHTIFDMRGSGGQVVAPGSIHPDTGRPYVVEHHIGLAPAPEWVMGLYNGHRPDLCCLFNIPLPADQMQVFIASLKISDEKKDIIRKGAPRGERSEAIAGVITALIGAGYDGTIVRYIMDFCPVGEKYRETGATRERWLNAEIARMTRFVGSGKAEARGPEAEAPPAIVCPPEPLRRALPTPDPFPMAALGDVLAPAAQAIAEGIKAPAATCGQAVLAAAALAVQPHGDVEIDGRVFPLSENFVTVGESGGRKSAVDQVALWPHRKHERALAEKYGEEVEDYKIKLAAHKKSREMVLAKGKTYEERQEGLRALEREPDAPLSPILITEDPTIEGLVKLLAIGQPSMGLFSDEGGRLIGGYGMSPENQLKTAAGLSGLWDGKPIDRVRGMDGASKIYGRRVSMHIMVQPPVASLFLGNELLAGQGLLARCLTAFPESTAGTRTYNEVDMSTHPAIRRYIGRMLDILETPLPLAEGSRNELDPPRLSLAADAKALWVRFHDFVERGLGGDGEFAPVRAFASKTAEHAARLAGILTLADDIHAREIPLDKMASGIELAKHYLAEALRLYHSGATDPDIELAERLLGWIQGQGRPHVWTTLIYQLGPSAIRDAKTAKRIIQILENHHWLEAIDGGMEIDGQFRRNVWGVRG